MNLPIPASLKRRPRVLNLLHAAGLFEPFSDTRESELDCLARHAQGARCAVEIGTALGRLLCDPARRVKLSAAGRARAGRYRWEDCARQSLELFQRL